jgi:hypothetical protein
MLSDGGLNPPPVSSCRLSVRFILLFIWAKNELLMAVGDPLRNDPRFEKLAAWPAPKTTDKTR